MKRILITLLVVSAIEAASARDVSGAAPPAPVCDGSAGYATAFGGRRTFLYAQRAARLIRVVEGIGLLAASGALSDKEHSALERWFSDYVTWMLTSPTGKDEREAQNNHGLWYDYQLTQYALFARRDDVARSAVQRVAQHNADSEINLTVLPYAP